jgi:hypothetical protein
MVERRRRPDLDPRWLTIGEAAQYPGHSPSWLSPDRLARLQETGFPPVDAFLERIDRHAIDDWSDRRSRRIIDSPLEELVTPPDPVSRSSKSDDPWVEAARAAKWAKS